MPLECASPGKGGLAFLRARAHPAGQDQPGNRLRRPDAGKPGPFEPTCCPEPGGRPASRPGAWTRAARLP